ncbi:hypothetical protein E4U09_006934 [Claviceps aff. purpurea]|uniref:Uncharacterized protein n=1 Tax=Claviceps aff. purpurea TaxID=1967640 RepID=A0A9P7QA29_9HYPO|nr:hypothetical protein E4U09_006934 [Claviceps aff. purpurea]
MGPIELLLIGVHNTMFSLQKPVKDPKGYHLTISYKLQRHVGSKRHITGHVYADGPRSRNVSQQSAH